MEKENLRDLAFTISLSIIEEATRNYNNSKGEELIPYQDYGADTFYEYVRDIIEDWDEYNGNVLYNMKDGPFESNGIHQVKDMIYELLIWHSKQQIEAEQNYIKYNPKRVLYKQFYRKLEDIKNKKGSMWDKLLAELEGN